MTPCGVKSKTAMDAVNIHSLQNEEASTLPIIREHIIPPREVYDIFIRGSDFYVPFVIPDAYSSVNVWRRFMNLFV